MEIFAVCDTCTITNKRTVGALRFKDKITNKN